MNRSATLTPPVSERDHIQGHGNALVTLVEYGDYQCPYCGDAHAVIKRLRVALGHNLRFVFRNFPLTQSHPYAMMAAQTAEAAALPAWANELGLDMRKFAVAINQGSVIERIKEDHASGIDSGVTGTPAFFINGTIYGGEDDYESLHSALLREEALIRERKG
jgi:protein-disulfide isomerase